MNEKKNLVFHHIRECEKEKGKDNNEEIMIIF